IDAACAVEPFVTQGEAGQAEGLLPFYLNTAPNLTVATYFTSTQYLEENREVVERFVRAMNRSLEFAQENPDEVRRIITEYTEMPAETVEQIVLPQWSPEITIDTVQLLAELSEKYGLIESQPDI